jgi:hypothetical protein
MKFNGVIAKLNNILYLFTYNTISNKMMDGIHISENKVYDNLKEDEMSIVNVDFRDGTLSIDDFDIEEFIYGNGYGDLNVFMYIQDIFIYKINTKIINLIEKGDFNKIAIECIDVANNDKYKIKIKEIKPTSKKSKTTSKTKTNKTTKTTTKKEL